MKIEKIVRNDGRSAEVDIRFSNGQVQRHYMTSEALKVQLLIEELQDKYGVPEEVIDTFVDAVRTEANRDYNDEERDL